MNKAGEWYQRVYVERGWRLLGSWFGQWGGWEKGADGVVGIVISAPEQTSSRHERLQRGLQLGKGAWEPPGKDDQRQGSIDKVMQD